jgi:hypothetical protein
MSSENMVVVQGQGLDIDELGIALHQETQSCGAEHIFYPCRRVFSVALCPHSMRAKTERVRALTAPANGLRVLPLDVA